MTPEIYAEWLRRQGKTVIPTASSLWHSNGLGAFQAFPYHWLIDPSDEEVAELVFKYRVLALRYSLSQDDTRGCLSHAIVFEQGHYDFDTLGHRTRKNTRRGLKNCRVEPISFEQLAADGWDLRRDTLDRQKRRLEVNANSWKSRYLAAVGLPGLQAWGAYVGTRLAAYLVTFRMEDCISVVDQQSHRECLDLNVNNAITFVVTQDALQQPGVRCVHYGVESLDAPPRVSEFKFHMGYSAKPIRQRVVFHPWAAPFANRLSYGVVSMISSVRPADRRFSKAKGMLKMYLSNKIRELGDTPPTLTRSATE